MSPSNPKFFLHFNIKSSKRPSHFPIQKQKISLSWIAQIWHTGQAILEILDIPNDTKFLQRLIIKLISINGHWCALQFRVVAKQSHFYFFGITGDEITCIDSKCFCSVIESPIFNYESID